MRRHRHYPMGNAGRFTSFPAEQQHSFLRLSNQCELMREKRFGETFRRTTFHAPQSR